MVEVGIVGVVLAAEDGGSHGRFFFFFCGGVLEMAHSR